MRWGSRSLALTAVSTACFNVLCPSAQAQVPGMPQPVLTAPGPGGVRIDEEGVLGNYFAADGAGPHAGVLLIGGSEGGLGAGVAAEAKALQAHGFSVLQVSYFGGPGQPAMLREVPLEIFDRAVAWLREQPGVDSTRIGVVGSSKGAEAALVAASRNRAIRAVVVGMPSSVVWPGIGGTGAQSSWTVDGQPVPFLPYAFGSDYRDIYGAYNNGLRTLAAHQDAAVPVERINGPIMLVCGEADTLWPSCRMSEQVTARLTEHGFRHDVQLLEYGDAGHAVFGLPIGKSSTSYSSLGSLGGTPEGNDAAREDDWPRALAFLAHTLGARSPQRQRPDNLHE